jgi:alpha-glucosidase
VFLDAQPDLNWRNPRVQEAMFDTLRFWLARGIDGFRIDVLSLLVEDDQLRDNPPNPTTGRARTPFHARAVGLERRPARDPRAGRVLLAELVLPLEQTVAYYGADGAGIQVPFNFELVTARELRGEEGVVVELG